MPLPPVEKIYEAWSALASGRVRLLSPPEDEEGAAEVVSSNHAKTYVVQWRGNTYASNDSATFWQGYPGYPVIAVIMVRGKIHVDAGITEKFANINWNEANKKAGRDYAKALENVFAGLGLDSGEIEKIKAEAAREFEILAGMNVVTKRYYAKKGRKET